jgi:hypothetical protein
MPVADVERAQRYRLRSPPSHRCADRATGMSSSVWPMASTSPESTNVRPASIEA